MKWSLSVRIQFLLRTGNNSKAHFVFLGFCSTQALCAFAISRGGFQVQICSVWEIYLLIFLAFLKYRQSVIVRRQ